MTIPEKIKQRSFKNVYHKLSLILNVSNSRLQDYLKKYLSPEGLTIQQYNILRILRGSRPLGLSTQQIRDRMFDRMSDTSRIVDRLVLKQLVTKDTNKEDHRLVDVRITPLGMDILHRLDGLDDSMIGFWSKLTTEEAETISRLLDKAYTN